jgi:GT2 family glycosyltransferase
MPVESQSLARADRRVTAVVVVATFRRPDGLAETLASLAAQIATTPFAVLVVENDAQGQAGRTVADRIFASRTLGGTTLVEEKRGHVQAVNAGFAAALARYPEAEYLLMIDDDELASPHWLAGLVDAAEASGADIVGGPVVPRFTKDAPGYLRRHPVFCSSRWGCRASMPGQRSTRTWSSASAPGSHGSASPVPRSCAFPP